MTAWLVIRHLSGARADTVEHFPTDRLAELTIGRDPSATIKFDPKRDDLVSRRHALIRIRNDTGLEFQIVDLGSSNGTYLNGRRIDTASALAAGDTIELGKGGPRLAFDVAAAIAGVGDETIAAAMAPPRDLTEPAPRPAPSEMPEGSIFISYAREDLDPVRTLARDLAAVGVAAWFDMEQLSAGDAFDQRIRTSIDRCSLFVPILSRNTEARREAFFRREWRYALDREMSIDPSVPFIVPVVIDDTKTLQRAPRRFLDVHMTWLPQGRATPAFVSRLRRLLLQFQGFAPS